MVDESFTRAEHVGQKAGKEPYFVPSPRLLLLLWLSTSAVLTCQAAGLLVQELRKGCMALLLSAVRPFLQEKKEGIMQEKSGVKKSYSIITSRFQDEDERWRRELDIVPRIIPIDATNTQNELTLHMIWYSNPDPQKYNSWRFIHIIINEVNLEIITEKTLIPIIASLSEEIQPQEFEQLLQAGGFPRRER